MSIIKPYGLISDLHCHAWSAFSSVDAEGRNTRLMAILNELGRCCSHTLDHGGDHVVIAGDLFHVRGSVDPEVFNPVKACIERWADRGITFLAIAGNHDLKSEDSLELGSAVAMLANGRFKVFHQPADRSDWAGPNLVLVPWIKDLAKLKKELEAPRALDRSLYDLVLHGGIDGTLPGMPAHGLSAEYLAGLGYRRVFSGHYHNAKYFGDYVFSIGAPTHQTWSDIDTSAGWWIIHPDREQFFASHAPNFVDIADAANEAELPLVVDGNYVRARIGVASNAQVASWRQALIDYGAKGVLIEAIPDSAASKRDGVAAKSLSSLRDSVQAYCREKGFDGRVGDACDAIMAEVL